VRDGHPVLEDGRVMDVATVIWCTGFRPDFGWIDLPVFDGDGLPLHRRGVVEGEPGTPGWPPPCRSEPAGPLPYAGRASRSLQAFTLGVNA
jgi:hypothetical protein